MLVECGQEDVLERLHWESLKSQRRRKLSLRCTGEPLPFHPPRSTRVCRV